MQFVTPVRSRLAAGLPVLLGLTGLGAASAQAPALEFEGGATDDALGRAVAFAGDVDQDGFVDLLVGAPDVGKGHAQLLSGADGAVLFDFQGVDVDGRFGAAVDGAGDIDLDGVPDVIVAAPLGGSGNENGRACVFSGATGAVLHNIEGAKDFERFGTSVAGMGDVDGDGCADFAVGVPGFDSTTLVDAGCVAVYSGLTGLSLYAVIGDGEIGAALDAVTDIDGDGILEFVAGAPASGGGMGRIQTHAGVDGSLLFAVDGSVVGEDFGTAVGDAGDVNGDGAGDVIIGFPGHDGPNGVDSGKAAVCNGADGTTLTVFFGPAAGDRFGTVVGPGGDLDADSFDDVLIATPDAGPEPAVDTGRVFLCSVRTGKLLWTEYGDGGGFGAAAAGGVDVNDGGRPDYLVGAPSSDGTQGTGAGSARLYTPSDLHFRIAPTPAAVGQPAFATTRGGTPGAPALIALTRAHGQPVIVPIATTLLDADGAWEFSQAPTPGLVGVDLAFRSYALGPGGSVQVGNEEELVVQ